MKVLIAEDDVTSRRILETSLKKLGHEVVTARDGEEAWSCFDRDPVRIIVSDWMMPGLDGLQLCRKVRARPSTPYTYFILLTALDANLENFHHAMAEGVDDFLSKPFNQVFVGARIKVAERILNFTTRVGQLESILPICMYCKKIRNDQDYWQQIEAYISEHTGTDFSHGICPDCYESVVVPQIRKMEQTQDPS